MPLRSAMQSAQNISDTGIWVSQSAHSCSAGSFPASMWGMLGGAIRFAHLAFGLSDSGFRGEMLRAIRAVFDKGFQRFQ